MFPRTSWRRKRKQRNKRKIKVHCAFILALVFDRMCMLDNRMSNLLLLAHIFVLKITFVDDTLI
jgi:hypothetical protein